jgi:hypothetical protein
MRLVDVVQHNVPYELGVPAPLTALTTRHQHAVFVECSFHGVDGSAFYAHHAKYAPYDGHGHFVHHVIVPPLIEPETVVRGVPDDNLSLLGLCDFASPSPLGGLGSLELGELVEDAIR